MGKRLSGSRSVLRELAQSGLLLLQDKVRPSVVSLLTGHTVRGSWRGHPKSHEIFRVLTRLANHREVLFCKLLAGKVTLVHRLLWPAFLGVATSRAAWQTKGLSLSARKLWRITERERSVAASGAPVRERTALPWASTSRP